VRYIKARERTYIKGCEAIPAEDVLATLAHHLRATRVALNKHVAHRALFYGLVAVPGHEVGAVAAAGHEESAVFGAGKAGVPGGQAKRAELLGTGGAAHCHALQRGYIPSVT
jgi:hypothetical protein